MPAAMTLISSQTLAAPALSVALGSIPATYRDLRLVVVAKNATGATATDAYFRINSDSGANYSRVYIVGSSSTPTGGSYAAGNELYFEGWSTTNPLVLTIDVLDYAQTDKHKPILYRNGNAEGSTIASAARWGSTSAVTQVEIFCTDQKGSGVPDMWAIGSTFYLYGIAG